MKNNRKYLLLLIPTLILVLAFIKIRENSHAPADLYELVPGYYINKVDYFSKYTIVKKTNDSFQTIVPDVEELYAFNEGYLVKYSINKERKIMYLSDKYKEPIIADRLNELADLLNTDKIIWNEPRKVVESMTLQNPVKLSSEILLILIVILLFYTIMKVFGFKKIKKISLENGA